jgi:hypothetical protein
MTTRKKRPRDPVQLAKLMHHNFIRIQPSTRVTPAMAAKVTDKLWSMEDVVALVEAAEPAPKKRGPYKKRERAGA